jgi:hypothetical protein
MPAVVSHRATVGATARRDSTHFASGIPRAKTRDMARTRRRERASDRDAVPELLGLVAQVLLIVVILWSLGYLQ